MELAVGIRVRARGLQWDIVGLERLGGQTRLRLCCVAGDLSGLEWNLLHPAETVEVVDTAFRPFESGTLAEWKRLHVSSLLDQLPGPDAILSTHPGHLSVEPYQLVPLLRALELARPRLLLADGVGLGKTIQAGLIATELIARRRAHRILVLCPPGGLLLQWEQEFRLRFGLSLTKIADAADLLEQRRRLEFGSNPFAALAMCVMPIDFAKQEVVLIELERSSWDLVIIDEAHHCIADNGLRGSTQRRRLAEVVARRSDGLLLLTATPHDGNDSHFASLIALLDPSLVDGKGALIGRSYQRHVIRRLKSQIVKSATGTLLFRNRTVAPVKIATFAEPVKVFHQALAAMVIPRLGRPDALAFVSLLKRSVSTIAACNRTLRAIAERYEGDAKKISAAVRKERTRMLRLYRKRGVQFDVLDAAAEEAIMSLEADEVATSLQDTGTTLETLSHLISLGEAALPCDPKLEALLVEVRLIRLRYPAANILVYTEYSDSLTAVIAVLRGAVGIDGEVLAISGSDTEADRSRAGVRFSMEPSLILVTTDSLAEGLNLHRNCFHLIHLDLPYNPNRLEQRNGRIDRYGQTKDPKIQYFCLAGTFEENLLLRLIAKYEKARSYLDHMPDTLGVTADHHVLATPLMAGFAESRESLFAEPEPTIRTLDYSADAENARVWRCLLHEIDHAYYGFDRMAVMHGWSFEAATGTSTAQIDEAAKAFAAGDRLQAHMNPGTMLWETGDVHVGRADPRVQRALLRARHGVAEARDARVSVAKWDRTALLLTYVAELHASDRLVWQQVIATLTCKGGGPVVIDDPDAWLGICAEPCLTSAWTNRLASWADGERHNSQLLATQRAEQLAIGVCEKQRNIADREIAVLTDWLETRSRELCGSGRPQVGDLFGATCEGAPWQFAGPAADRLASYASDPMNAISVRKTAEQILRTHDERLLLIGSRTMLAGPVVRPLGMLLLLP